MRLAAVALIVLGACAAPRPAGTFHVSATHYESMTGVTVGTGPDAMICSRDTITGSHIVRWYCRYDGGGLQYEAPIRFDIRVR
jgi:hypothetical protein